MRRRDPLSPLMFVIVMQVLGRMISIAVSGDMLSSFSMEIRVDISHLLFVGDTLF